MSDRLLYDGTLESFFFDQLNQAQKRRGEAVEPELEAYLVHVLASHARRPQVAGRTSPPLALQYMEARTKGPQALRAVGDRALYIGGVVPRSLDRGPVNVKYVAGIGSAAYREVAARAARLRVFESLAERFGDLLELVGDAVDLDDGDEDDLLALYEQWRRDGDAASERRLVVAGVLLDPDASDVLQ